MLLTSARFPTRTDEEGGLLRLEDQDRSRWDHALIERGLIHLANAAQGNELTSYHPQAGIAACHCTAPDAESTDWSRIVKHYDELNRLRPSPIVELNRAVAIAHLNGSRAGLEAIAAIKDREKLESHYLLHAVIGELQFRSGDQAAALESFRRALQLSQVAAERLYLTRMLGRVSAVRAPHPNLFPRGEGTSSPFGRG